MSRKRNDALFGAHVVLATLRSSISLLRWAILGLAGIYLASGITVVGPNESGLIVRFGKLQPGIHAPGLLFALPEPFDLVVKVPTRSLQEVGLDVWAPKPNEESLQALHPVDQPYTLTGDANIIRASFAVRYQISDPVDYVFQVKDRDALRDAILYQAATRTLAGMSVDDALAARKSFLADESMRIAQDEMNRLGLGIQLLAFEIRDINPPQSVLPAFQDVVSAKVQAKTLVEPANSYHATAIPQAQGQAYRINQEAQSYAQQIVSQAQGEASSFLAQLKEYRANGDVMRSRLLAETMEAIIPKMRVTTVVPSGAGTTRLLLEPQKADGLPQNPTAPTGLYQYQHPNSVPSFSGSAVGGSPSLKNNQNSTDLKDDSEMPAESPDASNDQ
jgi:membrane protease subunit HflK